MTDISKLVEKIAKLRAVAEKGNLGEEETKLFADKVAELLAQHNLSLSDLDREENSIIEEHWHTIYCDPWRRYIAHSAARLYFCDCYYRKWYDEVSHKVRDGIVFVGTATNIFVAKEMSEYLFNTTMRMAIAYAHAQEKNTHYSWRKTRLNYERGMGTRLAMRLRELREARSNKEAVKSAVPALYDEESARAKAHIDALGLKEKAGFTSKFTRKTAARAGFEDAEQVQLSEQIPEGYARDPGDPQ